jgi:monoamine oxidase
MAHLQNTWETDPTLATTSHSILMDFLSDLDVVYPGAKARARIDSKGKYVAHLEAWPSNPLFQGAYTANAPGYFTTIAGYEGPPVGNLYFAGETTDSFYSWQGFMEGGALSGVRVAGEINRDHGSITEARDRISLRARSPRAAWRTRRARFDLRIRSRRISWASS